VASTRFPGLLAHRTERQEKRERGISEENFPLRAFSPRQRPRDDGSIDSPISLPLPIHFLLHGATPPTASHREVQRQRRLSTTARPPAVGRPQASASNHRPSPRP